MSDEATQARLQAVEALASVYSEHTAAPSQDYYGTFLAKLSAILFGAAQDFGMKPIAFVVVGHVAPLGQELTTLNSVSMVPSLRSGEGVKFLLKQALASVERVDDGAGLSL